MFIPKEVMRHPKHFFDMFWDELGPKCIQRILGVSERTVRDWKIGRRKVSNATVMALCWETSYGRALMENQMVSEIQWLYRQNQTLIDQFLKAKDIVDGICKLHAGTANEAVYEQLAVSYKEQDFPSKWVPLHELGYPLKPPGYQASSAPTPPPSRHEDQAVSNQPVSLRAVKHLEVVSAHKEVEWYFGVPTQPETGTTEAIPPRKTAAAA